MRKLFGVLAVLIGLVAAVAGVGGAIVVGSDDIVSTPSKPVAGDAKVVVSRSGLLDYDGWTMRITASNAAGKVFIGSGHPVDVRDWTAGVTRADATEIATGGVRTQVVEGKAAVPPGDPATLPFWTAKQSGAGTQHLDLDLEAQPLVFYVGPVGTPGQLSLSVGMRIPHLFAYALGLAVLGLVLLAVGVVLLRRRRVRSAPVVAGGGSAEPTHAVDAGSPGGRVVERRHVRVAGVVLVSGLALAGCGAVPQRAGSDPEAGTTRPALTQPELAGVWKAYDRDNNAAIKAAGAPAYDPRPWAKVDTGLTLLFDHFQTASAKVEADRSKPAVLTHTAVGSFAPAFGSYPMYALTTFTVTSSSPSFEPDASNVGVALMTRARAASGWLMESSVGVPRSRLPKPAAAGAASTPTPADLKKARAAADLVRTYLTTGKGTIAVAGGLANLRKDVDETLKSGLTTEVVVTADYRPGGTDPTAGGAIRTIRVAGGLIAVASWNGTERFQAADNAYFTWDDKTEAKLLGQTGPQNFIIRRVGMTAVISIPDKGAPSVLGSEWGTLLNGS